MLFCCSLASIMPPFVVFVDVTTKATITLIISCMLFPSESLCRRKWKQCAAQAVLPDLANKNVPLLFGAASGGKNDPGEYRLPPSRPVITGAG